MKSFLIFICLLIYLNNARAAYYDTLPAGVRNLTYHFVQTGNITGSYGSSGDFKGYNVNANINADSIRGISAAVDTYLGTLTAAQLADFSFGTFEGSASSKVSAQALGAGYGVTDRFTVYGFIPFYSAEVDLKIQRTQKGRTNVGGAGGALQLENLPDVDLRLIQSLFVNYYHYQPLGKWKATNFGDAELGMMYQVKKASNGGALIKIGTVAPTGRKDDPDILQDIAFGDGQWDAFFEAGGGVNLSSDWGLDNWTRFTYQFPYTTSVRAPTSSTFPVSANKVDAKIKLGNKILNNLQGSYKLSEQWTTSLTYSFEYVEPSDYKSSNPVSDSILEMDTEKLSHTASLGLGYSTLALFKKKQFFMPINLNLSVQSIFAGKNVPKYERADFEVQVFF